MNKQQVEKLLQHIDEEITELARRWILKYEEVERLADMRVNIAIPATILLTVDSQLFYILEEEK
jgi:hypothetical protein